MALKGLTANDRANWEKTYQAQLQGRSKQEIDNAWINWNVKRRYGNDVYNKLGNASQREAYWNSHQDEYIRDSLKTITTKVRENEKAGKYKKPIQSIKMDSDATLVNSPDLRVAKASTPAAMKEFKEQSDAYHKARLHYDEEYSRAYKLGQEAKRDVQDIAEQVSPYYKKYKGTEYLPLNDDDWLEIAKEYNSLRDGRGENAALIYLQRKMQDTVSENQSIPEKLWNGFLGMGATAYATVLDATAGIAKGTYDFWSGEHKDIPGINTPGIKQVANYLDAIIDNDVTRYTSDVVKYGSFLNSDIEQAKETGIGNHPIIQTYAQETGSADLMETLFNANTVPNLMSQVGFTAGMATTGKALGALSRWGFRAYKGARLAQKMAETGKTAMQVRDALGRIQKAENIVNRYGIPAAVGTMEGLFNGLETKQQFMEDGQREIAEFQQKYVDEEFNRLIAEKYNDRVQQLTNEYLNKQSFTKGKDGAFRKQMPDPNAIQRQVLDELYEEAWANYENKYKDAEDQLEHNASIAGMTNFLINSGINGIMNQTLKATLFNPTTTGAIRQSRLGKIFKPRGRYKVSGTGANTTVEGRYGLWDQFKAMTKEPTGEFIEEYGQNISDEFSRGGANNNLQHFLRNKYEGDGSAHVGELWLDDAAAAFKAAGIAAVSKEAIRDGFYGALGSAMGMPTLSQRTTAVDAKGNIIKDADGRAKKTLFGRGLNSAGEVESNLERIARIMPWRSGALQAWNENKAMKKDVEETAKALQDWIRKPENRAKYDGSVGTFNWAEELQQSADANDVFGYKNSALGKAVNDAIMLDKLKGTEFYNSYMDQVFRMANLEADSEEAKQAVDIMRNNIATKEAVEGMSDSEILNKIKKNANSVLDRQSQIAQISRRLEKQFGELDDDTKESLIYGELQIADWEERHDTLDEEIHLAYYDAKVEDSVEKSSLSEEQKALIGKYGSIENAIATRDKYRSNIKELQESIAKIEEERKNNGKLTDVQKDILQRQKNTLEFLKAREKEFAALKDVTKDTNTVLSEAEIMDLDPVARAIMLNPKNLSNYSEKQQQVINRIIAAAEKPGSDFLTKVLDDGKISESVSRFLREYKAVVADPDSFSMYSRLAKSEAAKRAYKERYESIKGIEDYTQFAQALDKLFTNASNAERSTILRQLQKESQENANAGVQDNFNKYLNDRQRVADILKRGSVVNNLKNLSSDDIGLFTRAIAYLTEKGVNLSNVDAVVNTLGESDVNGNLFEQYVNELNKDIDTEDMVNFTSVGDVISTVKDVLEDYNREEQNSAVLHAPIDLNASKPQATAAAQATPAPSTSSEPGVFGSAPKTLDEANASLQKEKGEEAPPAQQPEPAPERTTIQEEFEKHSSPEVVNQVGTIENAINNEQDEAIRDRALEALIDVSAESFNTVEELSAGLTAAANKIDIEGASEEDKKVANVLRNANTAMMARHQVARARAARARELEQRQQQQDQNDLAQRSAPYAGYTSDPRFQGSPIANGLASLNWDYLEDNFSSNPEDAKYSPLLAFLEKYGARRYLETHDIDKATAKVYFLTDYGVLEEQRKGYEDNGAEYKRDNYPVFVVVESEDGPITTTIKEDGKEKEIKVQPVGVMPATGASGYKGAARLSSLRERIKDSGEGQEIISDADGNAITSKILYVPADAPAQTAVGENNTIQSLQMQKLGVRDRAELGAAPNKGAKRRTDAWKAMRAAFYKAVEVVTDKKSKEGKSYAGYTYYMPQHKGGQATPVDVWVREVHQTLDRNSNSTIVELLKNGDVSVLDSNSRISGFFYELGKILETIDDSSLRLNPGGEISDQLREEALRLQEALNGKYGLNNYIRVSGHSYIVKPTNKQTSDGKFAFEVYMAPTNGGKEIYLGEVHAGELSQAEQLQLLKNLILDGDNKVRMKDQYHALVRWNVNYYNLNTVRKRDNEEEGWEKISKEQYDAASKDLADVYDDDILEISKDSAYYNTHGVIVESPFDLDGNQREFDYSPSSVPKAPSTVANGDNATESKPLNAPAGPASQVAASNGATVDSNNGTVTQGQAPETPNPMTEAEKKAAEIAEEMQRDAEDYDLSKDESSYIEKITKRVRARVTSLIGVIDEKLRHTASAWDTPSSNIGTGLDELTRDFFNDRLVYDSNEGEWKIDGKKLSDVYPNGRSKDLSAFVDSLYKLKQGLTAQGITIVPRNVVATGTLSVTDAKGIKHTIDVAGTVDLIGYDKEGNWHLYDMKTMRSDRRSDPDYREKWALQLSLYKKFLQTKYKINIVSHEIIPIKVDYPTPKGAGGNVTYTVSEKEKPEGYNGRTNNQLLKDGRRFFMTSAPILLDRVTDLEYYDVNEIPLEGLSETEKAIVSLMKEQDPSVDPDKPGVQVPEGGIKKVEVETPAKPQVELDSGTGLAKQNDGGGIGGLFKKKKKKAGAQPRSTNPASPLNQYVEASQRWGLFEGRGLDNEATIKALMAHGMNEEKWNTMSPEDREHDLNCYGVKK